MNSSKKYAYQYTDLEAMRKAIIKLIAQKVLHRESMLVFTYLTDVCLNKERGDCHPGYATIADGIGVSLDTVERVMQQLQKLGVLVCRKVGFRMRKIFFMAPGKDLTFAPPTTAGQRTPTTAGQRSSTTAEQRSSKNIENLPQRSEQREAPVARPSGNSDLSDPHGDDASVWCDRPVGDLGWKMSMPAARGAVRILSSGYVVGCEVLDRITEELADGTITTVQAKAIIIAESEGVRYG